ncbi:MAG: methyl-viologen-reducing hydrogenase subunit delta [Desulfococcus sp. 4484_241]|nr:MAG: methyl-viologen-reducing hydrogenase subunit delta [Desulfococcus sp. 4484_241]
MADNGMEPKIVAFLCNWCTFTAADLAGTSRLKYEPNVRIIKVMCSSRVDPVFILKALLDGADGVLIGGCAPGDCHYSKGNFYARRKVALAKKLAESMGLDSKRIRLSWIPASEGPLFARVVNEFTESIKQLGDNPTKREVYI